MSSARSRPRRKAPPAAATPARSAHGKSNEPKSNQPKSTSAKPATAKAARPAAAAVPLPPLVALVTAAADDMKAVNVKVLNVRGLTDIADYMVVASGNSDRHVKSIAERVVQWAKASGQRPYGVEGENDGEWVLVDLPDVMVHIMLPRVREFYALEELWDNAPRIAVPAAPAARPARKPRKNAAGAPRRSKPRGAAGRAPRKPRG
jgi:ribosome-associated protein